MRNVLITKLFKLKAMSPETRECPFEGIYAVNVPDGSLSNGLNERQTNPSSDKTLFICSEQSSLNSRCNSNDHIQLQSRCSYNDATRSIPNTSIIIIFSLNLYSFNPRF
jgi:hypothetical protein